ncbi:MAG: hypothetical protein ABID40_02460, partial [Candidatus Bipolaricaulota bacterium]
GRVRPQWGSRPTYLWRVLMQDKQLGDQLAWKFEKDQVRVITIDLRPLGVGVPPVARESHTIQEGDEAVLTYLPYDRAGEMTCHVRYQGGKLWDLTEPENPDLVWDGGWVYHAFPHADFGVTFGRREP